MSNKSAPQECQVKVPHKSVKTECQTSVSSKRFSQECCAIVSSKSVLPDCQISVSCQGVPQLCPVENVICIAFFPQRGIFFYQLLQSTRQPASTIGQRLKHFITSRTFWQDGNKEEPRVLQISLAKEILRCKATTKERNAPLITSVFLKNPHGLIALKSHNNNALCQTSRRSLGKWDAPQSRSFRRGKQEHFPLVLTVQQVCRFPRCCRSW